MVGRRVGSWILEKELGHGGMGAVYEARHVTLGTRAAVKTISPGLETTAAFRERFHREANLQAQLRHPNVARVLDYVEDRGEWFLVVEYLEHGSLADRLDRGGPVTRAQAVAWTRQALSGLGHAHRNGIVHRDVKPANLLLTQHDEVVVADFGIARWDNAPGLTATGVAIGTPHYMSPEQVLTPDHLDGRSDIYSLGIVLYELLAGRKPFDGRSQFAILQAHVSEPPPPLRGIQPTVPAALEAVVMCALAKQPEHRYADCESMIRAIDDTTAIPSPLSMPQSPPSGATIQASRLFEKVQAEPAVGASSSNRRDQKRRVFRLRLASGVATTLFVASLLAYRLANKKEAQNSGQVASPPAITATTTGADTITSTGAQRDNPTPASQRPHKASTMPSPVSPPPVAPSLPIQQTELRPQPPQPLPVQSIPLPERPRIAVMATGDDPLLAGALEQEMERRLDRFEVVDEQGEPEVGDLIKAQGAKVSPKDLGAVLLKSGFQVLVLLRVEEAERRTKTIEGIEGNVKAARMRLNAYLLPANRTLGRGWTEPAEYTELSAVSTAKRAFIGATADLRTAIDTEWAQFRAGGGTP